MLFQFEEEFSGRAQIRVIGVGGAGGNAVNGMVSSGLSGVDFIVINTDSQALQENVAGSRLQIGAKVTRGLGSGGDPRVGAKAVEEDQELVAEALTGSDMVFVTAGMGGGTGTGAAPTIARIARELGALVVGIVTLPFRFEGKKRMAQGVEGLTELKREVDTLIVIPNERLLAVAPNVPLSESFRVADNVLYQATKGISDLITVPGLVNLDFADVRSIMAGMGHAIMGTGYAAGEGRAPEAARAAISSPLLEDVDIRGAQGVLVNITGSETMTLHEVSEVTGLVQEAVGDEANIIFGAVIDPEAGEELRVTVIATGFPDAQGRPAESPVQRVQSATPPLQKVESSPAASPSQPKPSPVRLGEEAQLPPRSPAPLHRAQRAEPSSGAEKTREQAMRAQAGTNADVGSPPDSRPRRSFGSLLDGLRSVPATEGDEPTDAASDEVGGADPSEARLGWTTREQPRFRAPQARDEEPVFGSDPASSSPPSRASHREDLDKPAFLRRLRD